MEDTKGAKPYPIRNTRRKQRPNRPTRKIQPQRKRPHSRRRRLSNIRPRRRLAQPNPHTNNNAPSNKRSNVLRRSSNNRANDIHNRRCVDTRLPALPINELAGKGADQDSAEESGARVHRRGGGVEREVGCVRGHDVEGAHERAVVGDCHAVDCADEDDEGGCGAGA